MPFEERDVVVPLDVKVDVPFFGRLLDRVGDEPDRIIRAAVAEATRDGWRPRGPVDFASLWARKLVTYTSRGTLRGGRWHLVDVKVPFERLTSD